MKENAYKSNFISTLILGITLLLLPQITFAQSSEAVLDQTFSYTCDQKSITAILLDLSQLSATSIAFDAALFSDKQKSMRATDTALRDILTEVLEGTSVYFEATTAGIQLRKKIILRNYIISGFIEDAETGERLVAATLYDPVSQRGAVSNAYGFFSLTLPQGAHRLECSYLGYQPIQQALDLQASESISFQLKPSLSLQPIEVLASTSANDSRLPFFQPGKAFGAKAIAQVPALGGESDVFRYLQTQPGITTGTDGIGGMHVRGGSTDQNLILLDGVPIFNPSHSLGLFSIFNSAIIKSVTLQRSGFSARYGGHLASVLDLRSKDGNVKHFQSELAVSTVATKLSAEIPFANERGGLMIATRRSHLDPLIKFTSRRNYEFQDITGETNYSFYDLNAKVNFKAGKKDRLYVSFYKGEDKYFDFYNWNFEISDYYEEYASDYQNTQSFGWGNTIAAFRWNHVFGDRLFSNVTLTNSRFSYQSFNAYNESILEYGETIEEDYYTRFYSDIEDVRLKIDFDFYWNANHQISWGLSGLQRQFEPGSISESLQIAETPLTDNIIADYFQDLIPSEKFSASTISLYVEDQIRLGAKANLSIGLRHAFYNSPDSLFQSLQPRLLLAYRPSPGLQLSLSASRMSQFLHLLTAADAGLPTDLWVPATARVGPQHGWEMALNIDHRINKNWRWHVAPYYKVMEGVLAFAQDASLPGLQEQNANFWEDEVVVGTGEAYGVETQLQWKTSRSSCHINYTWSRSFRTFSTLNDGNSFPFRFDRPHLININFQHHWNKKWSAQLHWNYGSGQPITFLLSEAPYFPLNNFGQEATASLSTTNGYRLPNYHRLDVNVSYQFHKGKHQHSFILGAYNLYRAYNPIYTYRVTDSIYDDLGGDYDEPGLSIIPTISYSWRFGKSDPSL